MKPYRLRLLFKYSAFFLTFCLAIWLFRYPSRPYQHIKINTWTIVAADAVTGEVGVAGASCVPALHIDAVAAIVPGVGAAAVQADFTISNRDHVFQLLQEGMPAAAIIQQVSDLAYDRGVETRQYGVVTIRNGQADAAAFTGSANFPWAGDMQDARMGVSVQGNFLVSEAVVRNSLEAFRFKDIDGHNTLADRLMRALEAGSEAGGDARCNNGQVQQTASSAFLMVADGSGSPYAIRDFGRTDAGKPEAPRISLSTAVERYGPNPVEELRRQYQELQIGSATTPRSWKDLPILLLGIGGFLLFGLFYLVFRRRFSGAK